MKMVLQKTWPVCRKGEGLLHLQRPIVNQAINYVTSAHYVTLFD